MEFPKPNPFSRSLIACAVAAGLALSAGSAAAQGNNDKQPTAANAETKRAEKDARKSWEQTHRASKIIGSEVRNARDQKVGRVKDLVLSDPSSGTISHFVVSVGGVAGMGDKLFAVPFNEVQHLPGKDYLVLSANSDLSKGFDDKNWPTDTAWQDRGAASRAVSAPATVSAPAPTALPPPATTSSSANTAPGMPSATTNSTPSLTTPPSAEASPSGTPQ